MVDKTAQDTDLADALKLAVEGNSNAFTLIYNMKVGLIQYIGSKWGLGVGECDDLVQETFIRLHRNLGMIQNVEHLDRWLVVTAKNLIVDQRRKEKRQRTDLQGDQIDLVDSAGSDNDLKIRYEIELSVLGDILDGLKSDRAAESFKLFYRDGLSAKEIAHRNGEAISTVTSRISRYRSKVKEAIKAKILKLR